MEYGKNVVGIMETEPKETLTNVCHAYGHQINQVSQRALINAICITL